MEYPKLKVGDIIEVHGWIMLAKLEAGKYRVSRISERFGEMVYWFTKPKGKKEIVGHYCNNVDMSIDSRNLNRIEVVKEA